jgi:membrane protein
MGRTMIRRSIRDATDWISRVIHHPSEELTHWQATARFWYDLARVGGRRLQEDRALQMAAALAFHTLFALMPLAIVSTALFKGMQGIDKLQSLVHQVVQSAGLDTVRIMPADGTAGTETVSLGTWLEDMIGKFGTIDLETLGLLGLAAMIYAAVAMMVTIEDCFNTIYRAPQGRSWLRRMPVYWTVLTVGPLGIALLFVVDSHVGRWIASVEARAGLIHVLGVVWSVGIITLMLLGTFVLLPNTQVSWRSAVGGAFVSAVLLHIGKVGLAAYINNAFSFSHLYGPLGFVPVLMLWTYAMWICILFGVEVAAIVQRLGGRHEIDEVSRLRSRSALLDASSVLLLMEAIAEGFEAGKAVPLAALVEDTGLPEPVATEILEKLAAEGFVHRVATNVAAYTLARPPQDISAESLIEFGQGMLLDRTGRRTSRTVEALRRSQRELAANTSLATLTDRAVG